MYKISRRVFLFFLMSLVGHECMLRGTLDRIKATNEVILGVFIDDLPFDYQTASDSYNQETDEFIGYQVDICKIVVENIKKRLCLDDLHIKYLPITTENRFDLLTNATYDLACGANTNNKIRQLIVEFSYTTYVDTVKIGVRAEDSEIKSLNELNGETITTIASTSVVQVIKNYEEANNVQFNVIYTNNNDESLALLASGEAKAWVYEATSMAATIASSPNPVDYVIVGEPLSYAPFGLMFQLNDPNFAAVVNEAVLKIFINRIYNKWFLSPIPPNGINLNIEVSPENEFNRKNLNTLPAEVYPLN